MHQFSLRVYYEDTDMAGIVYYANYLKYIERARSDWVRSLGIDQNRLRTAQGLLFAVRKITADYLQPAHFHEPLQITTEMTKLTSARLYLQQNIYRDLDLLFQAQVILVALNAAGKPTRLPAEFRLNSFVKITDL
mgnify:FL=1